jgi:hypothetical protein
MALADGKCKVKYTEIVETEEEKIFGCADAILQFQSAALNTGESGSECTIDLGSKSQSCKFFSLRD